MERILNRSAYTPSLAHYVKVRNKRGSALTLEYFKQNQEPLRNVPPVATLVTEEVYMKMVKAPTEPTGKAEKSPARDGQDKKKDLGHGRKTTKSEDEALKTGETVDLLPDKGPEIKTKRATPPVGKVKGKGADTEKPKMNEATDSSLYAWRAIHAALYAAGIKDEQDILAVKSALDGKEVVKSALVGEQRSAPARSFKELVRRISESPFDGPAADPADAAQAGFEAEMGKRDAEEAENPLKRGADVEDLNDELKNISKNDIDRVLNMPRGTKIILVKVGNGKVTKVIPSTLIRTKTESDLIRARVQVADKKTEVTIGRMPNVIYLRQFASTDQYVLVDNGNDIEPPRFNYARSKRQGSTPA